MQHRRTSSHLQLLRSSTDSSPSPLYDQWKQVETFSLMSVLKTYQAAEEEENVCRMHTVMQQLLSLTSSSLLNQTAGRRNNIGMLAPDSPSHQFSYQKVACLTKSPLEGQTPVRGTKLSIIVAQVTLFICSCHLSYHHDAGVGVARYWGCPTSLMLSSLPRLLRWFMWDVLIYSWHHRPYTSCLSI